MINVLPNSYLLQQLATSYFPGASSTMFEAVIKVEREKLVYNGSVKMVIKMVSGCHFMPTGRQSSSKLNLIYCKFNKVVYKTKHGR